MTFRCAARDPERRTNLADQVGSYKKWGTSSFHRTNSILYLHILDSFHPAQSNFETRDEGGGGGVVKNIGNNTILLFKHKKKT